MKATKNTSLGYSIGAVLTAGFIAAAPVQAQEGPDSVPQDPSLVPDAPHWVSKASSTVHLRFTTQWQRMQEEMKKRASATPAEAKEQPTVQPMAAVVLKDKMFNKDSGPANQYQTSIAVDPLNVNRIVGGYDDYRSYDDNTGWSISTDGGATVLKDGVIPPVAVSGGKLLLHSQGAPAVAVDKTGNFFIASLHSDGSPGNNAVTISRSPKAGSTQGIFSVACAGGNDPYCWPAQKALAFSPCSSSGGTEYDKPWIAVDTSTSPAAGSVYLVWTAFTCASGNYASYIFLSKCNNALTSCTAPFLLESTPATESSHFVQFSHATVGPTGKVYVSWVRYQGYGTSQQALIRMRVIAPLADSTKVGTVGLTRAVHKETLPIPWKTPPYSMDWYSKIATYPKVAVKNARAIIVWDQRTTLNSATYNYFTDSNIVAKTTDNDGASFSAVQTVSAAAGPQYMPHVCVDNKSGQVVVSYFSHQNDVFRHRQDVYVATSATGSAPYTPLRVTAFGNETEANPRAASATYIGDYIEGACRGGVAYLHYPANYTTKQDNDRNPVKQQDNFVSRITLP